MSFFVFVLLKRMSYNKETKREVENERWENEGSQNKDKKAIMANSASDPFFFCGQLFWPWAVSALGCFDVTIWWLE